MVCCEEISWSLGILLQPQNIIAIYQSILNALIQRQILYPKKTSQKSEEDQKMV